MSLLTTLTRMWVTRSFKSFTFTKHYDTFLSYQECDQLGLYIHIPFCKQICSFCPYCKVLYKEDVYQDYIEALIKEIHMIGSQYPDKKEVTSLYFGGGTPALADKDLKRIMEAVNSYFIITQGIGLELHPDNVTIETLARLKEAGVTKISIGIQSFQSKFQHILGRRNILDQAMKKALDTVSFETVSMDFIFALPHQTFDDLVNDIEKAFSIGANHIAIYPFIDFTFTKSNIPVMSKKEKRKLLDDITYYCKNKGYQRQSIWTFSKEKASYSSMTRDYFLGFGVSAATLLKDSFKINTFDIPSYIQRINKQTIPTSLTMYFTKRQRMIYYLFWTLYSTEIDSQSFEEIFNVPLKKVYGLEFYLAKKMNLLTKENNVYKMTLKGAFYYHYYENFYTLSYIDKMWSILKEEPFPNHISL
ncbi:coproporphyrinogen-III oxidase family protein [Eggerthia catenaformis]|uniref:coproporphyrinogen-III oxidase family protein n=1 Tax=Eggerthia catenaformis TaxID=31973 RepID=UPI00248D8FA7|nr:radical SAM protein [Eggerthia catenaformis]